MTRHLYISFLIINTFIIHGQHRFGSINLISGFKQNDTIYLHINRMDFVAQNFDNRSETFLLRNKKGKLALTSRLKHFKYKPKTIILSFEQIAFLKRLELPVKPLETIFDKYNVIKLDTTSYIIGRPIESADTLRSYFIKHYFKK